MKKAILGLIIILTCLFTACFAGFSIAMTNLPNQQHVSAIAKPLKDASTQQSQILQTPTENDSYYKKLVNDVSQYDGSVQHDTLSTTFKHHTVTGITTHRDSQNWTNYNPCT